MLTDTTSQPLISVIIPVFNTGPYLIKCLDSVIEQTYQNLDIIIVNDDSTDGSAALCQNYADKDARIRLIHKPLGGSGVGAARNSALALVEETTYSLWTMTNG